MHLKYLFAVRFVAKKLKLQVDKDKLRIFSSVEIEKF